MNRACRWVDLMRARYALAVLLSLVCLPACSDQEADPFLAAPLQSDIPAYAPDGRGLRKVATFEAQVLVLSRKDYDLFLKDALSEYAPIDLAVAWGEAARLDVRKKVRVWQRDRYSFWHADREAWQDDRVSRFGTQSANWHVIPADKNIARAIFRVDEGDVVALRGFLVDIVPLGGGRGWKTSRTRTDKGGGACEIFLVTEARQVAG